MARFDRFLGRRKPASESAPETPDESRRLDEDGSSSPVMVTGRYRRRPGAWIFAALLLIPLALALVGMALDGGARTTAQNETAGQAASPAPSVAPVGDPIRVTTEDDVRTVTARVPDEASHRALIDGVKAASEGKRVKDEVTVDSAADAPPVVGIGSILAAGRAIPDLGVVVDRASLTLTGTPQDSQSATATAFTAGQSYPGVRLVDQLRAPGSAPAKPLTAACEQVRQEVAADLKANPVQFRLSGAEVTPESQQRLQGIAAKLGQCQFNAIEVAGHTDSTGSAAVNDRLSQRRAESVRDVLVAGGVPQQIMTARGYGASRPVADNATPEGQAANRRVEINAS